MPTTLDANLPEYLLRRRLEAGDGGRRALLTDSGALTYEAVDRLATAWASVLADGGLRPGERVILSLPDGPDYVAALFGVLRAGGIVVMANPHQPLDQIRWLYGYTRATIAIIHADTVDTFEAAANDAGAAPALLVVGRESLEDAVREAANAPFDGHPARPDDAAIWLFSGGTTGRPKGVVQTHRSFINTTCLYGQGILKLTPDDVTLAVPKLFFGYATGSNLFFPFSVGATSALFPERCTAATLFDKIEGFRPTVLVNVPTMINNMLSYEGAGTRDVSSLRLATSAGEALPEQLHQRWKEIFGVPLLDGLGTAEMWHIFISNRLDDVRPGTLGKVVPGFTVRVCDTDGSEVETGEVGTMWVKGDSLALGYWDDLEKTADAFRDGWFVSSDMIAIDADGYVTYQGRADDMIKVSGKWFSPGELENCLLAHDKVREVAVVGVTTADGLVKPNAFVVPGEGVRGDADLAGELQDWARARLEPYKYPRSVTFMDDFPRTHLGKVDRGRLAAHNDKSSDAPAKP